MQDILDIVFMYSRKEKLLDRMGILRIMDLLFQEYNLEVMKNITITNYNSNQLAFYVKDGLFIFPNKIEEAITKELYKSNYYEEDTLTYFECRLRENLFIVSVLFHEFEHILQDRLEKKDTLEDNLISTELDYVNTSESYLENKDLGFFKRRRMFKDAKKLYQDNYKLSILERLANINSQENIVKMLEPVKDDYKDLYRLQEILLLHNKMQNFKNTTSMPTIEFFINMGLYDKISSFDFINLNKEDRIRLGIKIDSEDFYNNMNTLSLNKKKKM